MATSYGSVLWQRLMAASYGNEKVTAIAYGIKGQCSAERCSAWKGHGNDQEMSKRQVQDSVIRES
jgi:hypothetical protein